MFTLPRLIEEDIVRMEGALGELLARSEASSALILDKAGFIIASQGDTSHFDATTLAALAAASFTANQAIANLISEPNFSSVYQQGEQYSLLVVNVDEHCLLVIIFRAALSVGAVKYYARDAILSVIDQLDKARRRAPDEGLDLAMLNVSDTSSVFKRKTD